MHALTKWGEGGKKGKKDNNEIREDAKNDSGEKMKQRLRGTPSGSGIEIDFECFVNDSCVLLIKLKFSIAPLLWIRHGFCSVRG